MQHHSVVINKQPCCACLKPLFNISHLNSFSYQITMTVPIILKLPLQLNSHAQIACAYDCEHVDASMSTHVREFKSMSMCFIVMWTSYMSVYICVTRSELQCTTALKCAVFFYTMSVLKDARVLSLSSLLQSCVFIMSLCYLIRYPDPPKHPEASRPIEVCLVHINRHETRQYVIHSESRYRIVWETILKLLSGFN